MKSYRYHYLGTETVHLPTHNLTIVGNDPEQVYEVSSPIEHPLFREVQPTLDKKKGK